MTIKATNIQFVNTEGNADETQFDTHDEHDLAELPPQLCKENNFITVIKGEADWETGVLV